MVRNLVVKRRQKALETQERTKDTRRTRPSKTTEQNSYELRETEAASTGSA